MRKESSTIYLYNFYKSLSIILLLILFVSNVYGDVKNQKRTGNIPVVVRHDYFSSPKTYRGVAKAITTMSVYHGFNNLYRGEIEYAARPGTIFQGPVYNEKREIIKNGDILFKFNTVSREKVVEFGKAKLKKAEISFKLAEKEFNRYRELIKQKAVSLKLYQQKETEYYKSYLDLYEQQQRLWMDNYMLEKSVYNAPFDGVVDEVSIPAGWVAGELEIMKVSQLYPMGIEVKMERDKANLIDSTIPVKVYPPLGGDPVGVDLVSRRLTKEGIVFYVDNHFVNLEGIKKHDAIIVDEACTVIKFNENAVRSSLAVNRKAIRKDKNGTYIWIAEGQSNLSINDGMSSTFKLKKVYIETGNKITVVEPGVEVIVLKENKNVRVYDIAILSELPKGIKDGQLAMYRKQRYIFMPGDPVKVEIGG